MTCQFYAQIRGRFPDSGVGNVRFPGFDQEGNLTVPSKRLGYHWLLVAWGPWFEGLGSGEQMASVKWVIRLWLEGEFGCQHWVKGFE